MPTNTTPFMKQQHLLFNVFRRSGGIDGMRWLVACALVVAVTGCASAFADNQPETAGAMVGIVNHTDRYIYSASVDGAGGGGMPAYGAGGSSICCAVIPAVWYPGMKVIVRWNMPIGRKDVVKEKEVEVERYEKPGSIYIHVFENDQIRVVVTDHPGYSPVHPIPAPVPPVGWKKVG